MANTVFIPSRGRIDSAQKLAKVWESQGFGVHFVTEYYETDNYIKAINNEKVTVHRLPDPNRGIGYSRMHAVNLAASFGYKSIILADDDIRPSNYSNMVDLCRCANNPKILGITARYGYHDLCLGQLIRNRDDIILLPTGTFRLIALNVNNVLDIGNYDKHLEYAEDCDLFLRGLAAGYPWMIHLGTKSNSTGNRYQPGGMLDYAGGEDKLKAKKRDWHEQLYAKYPDVVNNPAKADFTKQNSIRISWRRAYDKYLPGWKNWSMLHGGNLTRYLGA
jgi:hypothetical protein